MECIFRPTWIFRNLYGTYHFAIEWYYVWEGLVPSKRNLIEKMNSFGAKVGASRFGTVHFSPLPLNYIASQQHFAFNR